MDRERIAHLRSGIHKAIRKLRAQHWRHHFAGAFESLPESVSGVAALRTHMTCNAAIYGRIAKRVASIQLQKLRHCEGGHAGEKQNSKHQESSHLKPPHPTSRDVYLNRTRDTCGLPST